MPFHIETEGFEATVGGSWGTVQVQKREVNGVEGFDFGLVVCDGSTGRVAYYSPDGSRFCETIQPGQKVLFSVPMGESITVLRSV